jgi:hypothetical protein
MIKRIKKCKSYTLRKVEEKIKTIRHVYIPLCGSLFSTDRVRSIRIDCSDSHHASRLSIFDIHNFFFQFLQAFAGMQHNDGDNIVFRRVRQRQTDQLHVVVNK